MIVEIVLGQFFWLNVFNNKYGFYKTMSPCQIMSGLKIDYHWHCRIYCGQYVQTYEHHGNNIMERTEVNIELLHNVIWKVKY